MMEIIYQVHMIFPQTCSRDILGVCADTGKILQQQRGAPPDTGVVMTNI